MPDKVVRFDSVAEFARVANAVSRDFRGKSDSDWYGGLTFTQAVNTAISGDDSLVPEAEKLLEKLDASYEVSRTVWKASVAGAFPIVPEYLAGAPDCMRMRARETSDRTPISVYVAITSSGGLDAKQLMNRGITILALVMKLQEIRPVTLHIVSTLDIGSHKGNLLFDTLVSSQPIDLSSAAFVLTSTGFDRHLNHTLAYSMNSRAHWASDYRDPSKMRDILGMSEQDLWIPPSHLSESSLINEPLKWLAEKLDKITIES